jgi:hypothetical protein
MGEGMFFRNPDGKMLDNTVVPRWIAAGAESKARTAVPIVALTAAIGAKKLRDKGTKISERRGNEDGALQEVEQLRRRAHVLHAVVPAATGWLLFSHLKQDMRRR